MDSCFEGFLNSMYVQFKFKTKLVYGSNLCMFIITISPPLFHPVEFHLKIIRTAGKVFIGPKPDLYRLAALWMWRTWKKLQLPSKYFEAAFAERNLWWWTSLATPNCFKCSCGLPAVSMDYCVCFVYFIPSSCWKNSWRTDILLFRASGFGILTGSHNKHLHYFTCGINSRKNGAHQEELI